MTTPNDPDVRRRSSTITDLGVVDRVGSPGLTALTRLLTYVTGATAAAVHILDDAHQHRVAATNAPLIVEERSDSFCRLVVDGEDRIVCADAYADGRFGYSSYVRGPEPVRFYAAVPLRTGAGVIVGTLCAWDIVPRSLDAAQLACLDDLADQAVTQIEMARTIMELGHAAAHDPLTGAVNRLVLADRLAQAFARRLRTGGETLVAVVDVDDFKSVNDMFGHTAGDDVLVAVAERLRGALRAHDTVARIGGDEFAVIAEVTGHGIGAAELVARLRSAFDRPLRVPGTDHEVRVSVGAAPAQPGDDPRAALARADRHMYRRKARQRVRT